VDLPHNNLLSLVVAILTATNKLLWAKEYRNAKDETIRAKEAQIDLLKNEIENLREFTSSKVRESFLSMKQQLEEYIEELQRDLEKKNEAISTLQKSEDDRRRRLTEERNALSKKIQELEIVTKDKFIGDMIQRSFFGYDITVKGDTSTIQDFRKRASELGESKGSAVVPVADGGHVVQLSYANAVSTQAIETMARDMGLDVIEVKSVRGFTF
jgi:DNA repair exonuclease SbcCD ATPase subunit